MYAVEKLSSYITRGVYTVSSPFHPFGGAVDIIVVQQQDGSFKSSPWYVRFGKFQGVLKTREKVVSICVNGVDAGFHMYLDHKGEAYFLKDGEAEEGDFVLSSSPQTSGDEMDVRIQSLRFTKANSCREPISPTAGNGKIVVRTNSRRSGILHHMFGRRSMKDNSNDQNVQRASSMERAEIAADLLETKWSTNLPPSIRRTDSSTNVAVIDKEGSPEILPSITSHDQGVDDNFALSVVSKEHTEEVSIQHASDLIDRIKLVSDETTLGKGESDDTSDKLGLLNPINDNSILSSDHSPPDLSYDDAFDASVDLHGESLGNDLGTSNMREMSYKAEEVIQFTSLETSDSPGRSEISFESVVTESDEFNVHPEGSISKNSFSNDQSPSSHVPSLQSDQALDNMNKNVSICDSPPIDSSGNNITESQSSPGGDLLPYESEVIYQNKEIMELAQEKETSSERVDFPVGGTQANEESSTRPVICSQPSGFVQPLCYGDEPEIQSACNVSKSLSSNGHVERMNVGEGFKMKNSLIPNGVDIAQAVEFTSWSVETVKMIAPSPEISEGISEDDQFLFGDIKISAVKEANPDQSLDNTIEKTDDRPLLAVEDHTEDCDMKDVNDEQPFKSFSEVSRAHTSPMTIPRIQSRLGENELSIRSLPIIRSYIHDLESSDLLHPLSCSLNLSDETNEQNPLKRENSSLSKLKVDSESKVNHFISKDAVRAVDADKWGGQKDLSLSGHLLFEGMETTTASHACDADKEQMFQPQGMIAVNRFAKDLEEDKGGAMVLSERSWNLWPFFRKSTTMTTIRSAPESTTVTEVNSAFVDTKNSRGSNGTQKTNGTKKKKVRSLAPTTEELASLNLKEGSNMITFTFSTAMLGQQQVDARVYLWKWNTRIVVSDVDGTITKSDVLGQFMPLVGVDWSHTGVVHLFSAIKENGYQLLFLSARSISQAYITRQFLFNLKQDGISLPDGPVVISPDGLFPSLYREVIRRAPHEFKISCLEDIRVLFPPDCNPFYAGFGNRDTDEISYLKVGIPKGKIFIINPKGEVAVNRRVDTKSYTSLHALVSGMFPPTSSAEQEDYNSWNYWKLPLPAVDV